MIDHIVFYGTLMQGFGVQERMGVKESLEYMGPCEIPGTLYDLGAYPGLKESRRFCRGELFRIIDHSVLTILDDYEDYSTHSPGSSLYHRKSVTLTKPPVEAWVYYYTPQVPESRCIPHGDWRLHKKRNN